MCVMVLDEVELKMKGGLVWLVKKYLTLQRARVYCWVLWLRAQCRNSHIKAVCSTYAPATVYSRRLIIVLLRCKLPHILNICKWFLLVCTHSVDGKWILLSQGSMCFSVMMLHFNQVFSLPQKILISTESYRWLSGRGSNKIIPLVLRHLSAFAKQIGATNLVMSVRSSVFSSLGIQPGDSHR